MKNEIIILLIGSIIIGLTVHLSSVQSVEASELCFTDDKGVKHCVDISILQTLFEKPGPGPCLCPLGWNWNEIVKIPDNETLSVTVKHGQTHDTVAIAIPHSLTQGFSTFQNSSTMIQ